MTPVSKQPEPVQRSPRSSLEGGNILIILLVAIALLALLTQMVSRSSEEQSDTIARQAQEDEISRMLTQTGALSAAVNQMVANGEPAASIYTNLSQLKSGDAGFTTAPHNMKIYHPMGGGIKYISATSSGSSPVASGFNINQASIITGVGPTDVTTGDVVFTALISAASYCQRINAIQTGSTSVPVMATATFNALFTAGTTVTVAAGNCANCVNVPRICVSNTGATAWGYYDTLFPG